MGKEIIPGSYILNRYEVLANAGAGSFGTVYAAWDPRIRRKVAIKCMAIDQTAEGGLAALEEVRTAARVTDANIVTVHDFAVDGDMAYIIMEFVEGMTLTSLMRQYHDLMDLDVIAAVFDGIAHALDVAHRHHVLHLDVKPDNVLITRDGSVKVTDFGLSRLADATGHAHVGGGTIGYMPPEQMRQLPLDVTCDEWALASLTYEMISGGNPFFANDLPTAISRIENAELVLPSLCMNGLSEEFDNVIFYALDPDSTQRYRTVRDFAEEAVKFLGKPARGRRKLASIAGGEAVGDFDETTDISPVEPDEADSDRTWQMPALFADHGVSIALRVWAVISAGVLGASALISNSQIDGATDPIFIGGLLLLMAFAAWIPHVGLLLTVCALAGTLIMDGAYIVGGVVAIAALAWWWGIARIGKCQANTGLSSMLAGSANLSYISPLLSGMFLDIRLAMASAGFNWLVALVLAGCGTFSLAGWSPIPLGKFGATIVQNNVFTMLTHASTWIVLLGWVAAAALVSLICGRGLRVTYVLGPLSGTVVLAGTLFAVRGIESLGSAWMPEPMLLAGVIVCGLAVAALGGWGMPQILENSEEE